MMRKRIINPVEQDTLHPERDWLDIENIAIVEVSSEDTDYPIESALLSAKVSGWRASDSGKQTIRLIFDHPQQLEWIKLGFEELAVERTQEYLLRWSSDKGESYQEIVRQQWNFSPEGSTSQIEEYHVQLSSVTTLELIITPDIGERNRVASLKQLRLA
jgi:hypothetical protein